MEHILGQFCLRWTRCVNQAEGALSQSTTDRLTTGPKTEDVANITEDMDDLQPSIDEIRTATTHDEYRHPPNNRTGYPNQMQVAGGHAVHEKGG